MAAILDFIRNAITKVRSVHTPMSCMLGNPMAHTKVMILLPFYKKNINLRFHLAQIAPILDFINNAMSFLPTSLFQISLKPLYYMSH